MFDRTLWKNQAHIISQVLEGAPSFDKTASLPPEEFTLRQQKVLRMLEREGYDCGVVYSDEHYCGDVPYLAGNNNIMVEPVAAVIARKGLYFIAGLESGIVAEQLCHRSGVNIRRVDILRVDHPKYPPNLPSPADIIEEACGFKPRSIALLTSRSIFPLGLYNTLRRYVGEEAISDLSQKYYEIKYEKSEGELRFIEESCQISDAMLEGMLRILRPGLTEAQVAGWGYEIANELGAEEMGFRVMVTSGINNRSMVGRATNRAIREGDTVHIGVSPKRDGLCGAQRTSVQCVGKPSLVTGNYRVFTSFLQEAFAFSVNKLKEIARDGLPGCTHEKAMIEFYRASAPGLEQATGLSLPRFEELKGYVTSHNSGYTECQEMYGALSTDFTRKCAERMVLMLDVGLKGYGAAWDDIVIPGLDYIVIEKTAGKFGRDVRVLNRLPADLQYLVGEAF